jgi:hypothetical protein
MYLEKENYNIMVNTLSVTPVFNIIQGNESIATDTIFADYKAFINVSTCAQIFFGIESMLVAHV